MTTSISLAQRLLRFLTVKDASSLSAQTVIELKDAINQGLAEYYSRLPSFERRRSIAYTLAAPVTASNLTRSNVQHGQTVSVSTDAGFFNRALWSKLGTNDTVDLMFPVSTNGATYTIFGDILPMGHEIERLVTNPILETGEELFPDDNLRLGSFFGGHPNYDRPSHRGMEIGTPRAYWMDQHADYVLAEDSPTAILRVYPLPKATTRIRVEAILAPPSIKTRHVVTEPYALAIPDHHIARFVVPLAGDALVTSAYLRPDLAGNKLAEMADRARFNLSQEHEFKGVPNHHLRTPRGW